jgi:hypothetical protein
MLNVNYIINFLDTKQISIDEFYYKRIKNYELKISNESEKEVIQEQKTEKLDKYDFYIPPSFTILFEKSIKDYYYDSKLYRNKSFSFTFMNSVFLIENKFFNLNNDIERERIIKQFIKKMNDELFEKDLYNKFEYSKNRKINKTNLQAVLQNSIQFKNDDYFHLLITYISNYLGINIYVFHVTNHNIDFINTDFYLTNNCLYNPHFVIIFENEIYKPVMMVSNNRSILTYDKNQNIIDNIWNYLKINDFNMKKESEKNNDTELNINEIEIDSIIEELTKEETNTEKVLKVEEIKKTKEIRVRKKKEKEEECDKKEIIKSTMKYNINDLKNSKIDILKKICEEEGISTVKPSEKTSKMINKFKNELLDDILHLCTFKTST